MSADPGATTEPFSERSLACRQMRSGLPGAQGRGLAVFLTRRAARAGPHNAEAWFKDAPWLLFCLWANADKADRRFVPSGAGRNGRMFDERRGRDHRDCMRPVRRHC